MGIFYQQNDNQFIPFMSTLLAQNLLAHALKIADPGTRARALKTLEPVIQKLTKSTAGIVDHQDQFTGVPEDVADPTAFEPFAVKGLTLRGYLDLVVYLQNLSRKLTEAAA